MKKITLAASLLISAFSFSAVAAQLVSQQEVDHYKLVKIGSVNVAQTGGAVSSPSDLHERLSKLADGKGGAYYRIVAAKQVGPNFQAFADVYKDADK